VRLPRRRFRHLVREAVEGLPPEVKGALDNLTIVVQDWPTPEQLERAGVANPLDLLGLFEGVPLPERPSTFYPLPNKVTLFRRPLEEASATYEDLLREVRTTLLHEIGHSLGWSDADLERRGYG